MSVKNNGFNKGSIPVNNFSRPLSTVFTPHISDDLVLYWTNNSGAENPIPVQLSNTEFLTNVELEQLLK